MKLQRVFALLFALSSFLLLVRVLFLNEYPDFRIYYTSALLFLEGVNPYTAKDALLVPFLYPPITILIFLPFLAFSLQLAGLFWTVINIFLLLVSFYVLIILFEEKITSNSTLILFGLTCLYFPVKYTLGMGQINILVLFVLVLFIYFYKGKRIAYAGSMLSVAILLKIVPIIILPYLLLRKEFKIVFVVIFSLLFVTIVSFLIFGPMIYQIYLSAVIPELLFSPWKGDYYNQALTGLLTREITDIQLRLLLKNFISASLVFITFFILWWRRKTKDPSLAISVLITLSLIVSSFSWQHHFVWLLIPYTVIFFTIREYKLPTYFYVFLGISYILTGFNISQTASVPTIFQSHVLYGTIILWLLNLYLLHKYGR